MANAVVILACLLQLVDAKKSRSSSNRNRSSSSGGNGGGFVVPLIIVGICVLIVVGCLLYNKYYKSGSVGGQRVQSVHVEQDDQFKKASVEDPEAQFIDAPPQQAEKAALNDS